MATQWNQATQAQQLAALQTPQGQAQMQTALNPPTGLIGREQALRSGTNEALAILGGNGGGYGAPMGGAAMFGTGGGEEINLNRDMAMSQINSGVNGLQGYAAGGAEAQRQQAALSGALGPQAQAQAYQNFQASPGQQWLQEQAERGLTRNAAAIGGLGGGNVRQALQAQAMGLAQQDYQNQFNNLTGVADRGLNAANSIGNLRAQGGQFASAAGGQHAGLDSSRIGANASMYNATTGANASMYNTGINNQNSLLRDAAGYAFDSGVLKAGGRTDAGNAIANNVAAQTSALSNLINGQGINAANVFSNAGQQQGASYTDYANALGGYNQNAAATNAGLPGIPGTQQTTGILGSIGNALSGAGAAATGYAAL